MTKEDAIKSLLQIDCPENIRVEAESVLIQIAMQEPCDDCISREQALKVIANNNITGEILLTRYDAIIDGIYELPSVKPKRIKGKWVYNETKHRYKCSLCTMENYENSNYCPYCGADMRKRSAPPEYIDKDLMRTVRLMNGDWQDRFRAEYYQTKIRYERLHKMVVKYEAGKLDYVPNCSLALLKSQAAAMGQYLYILETRAQIENITL